MLTLQFSRPNFHRLVSTSCLTAALTLVGVGSGLVPSFSTQTLSFSLETTASAQEFNDNDVRNYARIVLEMESTRQTVLSNIETIIGSKPNEIPCYQPRSLRRLPRDARELALSYCNDYRRLIESRGLSISRFNTITERAQADNGLKRRIQNAMIEIQRQ